MRTGNNPGTPNQFVVVGGSSADSNAHGGRDLDPPPVMNKRIQVRTTDHPSTDRWVSRTTVRDGLDFAYRVGIVDGFNTPVEPPRDYPTLRRARSAANRLVTKENA